MIHITTVPRHQRVLPLAVAILEAGRHIECAKPSTRINGTYVQWRGSIKDGVRVMKAYKKKLEKQVSCQNW